MNSPNGGHWCPITNSVSDKFCLENSEGRFVRFFTLYIVARVLRTVFYGYLMINQRQLQERLW